MIIKWATALRRWNTGNTSRYVVFPPVRENCLQCSSCCLCAVRKGMEALARASVSEEEERNRRFLEAGNELLQIPPSSKALGFVSNTKEINFPKAFKKQRKQRKRKILPSPEEGKATDDPTPPTTTMQHNLTSKGVRRNKRIKVVDVHGYEVKVSNAPIVAAIFAKYGDIAANCQYKSLASRASLLDVVCDVVKRLKTGDVGSSSIKYMKALLSAAADVQLDVTWLQQYLDEISEEEDMEKRLCMDIYILLR